MVDKYYNQLHYFTQKYKEYNQPLYLSYPGENYWAKTQDSFCLSQKLWRQKAVDLYIHFPYCSQLCYFCCCEKEVLKKEEDIEDYLELLKQELQLKYEGQSGKTKVNRLHLGGGTPTLMTEKHLIHLYHIIERFFDISNASCNLEAYPDKATVTPDKLKLLYELGFHSLSIGIQDFNERVQAGVNRKYTKDEVSELFYQAKREGFKINFDVCYGLPFQGLNEFEATLTALSELRPEKIVIYAYTHFPYTYPLQRKIPALSLPNDFIKHLQIALANQILAGHYTKCGMDTFIKNTELLDEDKKKPIVRDYMGSTLGIAPALIGIGMSAISKVDNVYIKNTTEIIKYRQQLKRGYIPIEKSHEMTSEDMLRSEIIQRHILGNFKIPIEEFNNTYSKSFEDYFVKEMEELQFMEKEGLISILKNKEIKLTEYGKLFARCIARVFNVYYT